MNGILQNRRKEYDSLIKMMHRNEKTIPVFIMIPIIGLLVYGSLGKAGHAFSGSDVFRGFTSHIADQIRRDKQDFFEAQTCISWFYDQMKKRHQESGPRAEKISFRFASQPNDEIDCASRYPGGMEGLEVARKEFSTTQHSLSFSLTFYEFALVGDGNDDGQYNGGELRDVFESFGMNFDDRLPSDRYLVSLKGKFDHLRSAREIQPLVRSMESLLEKGYRFTSADQEALNRELE